MKRLFILLILFWVIMTSLSGIKAGEEIATPTIFISNLGNLVFWDFSLLQNGILSYLRLFLQALSGLCIIYIAFKGVRAVTNMGNKGVSNGV